MAAKPISTDDIAAAIVIVSGLKAEEDDRSYSRGSVGDQAMIKTDMNRTTKWIEVDIKGVGYCEHDKTYKYCVVGKAQQNETAYFLVSEKELVVREVSVGEKLSRLLPSNKDVEVVVTEVSFNEYRGRFTYGHEYVDRPSRGGTSFTKIDIQVADV